VSAYLKWRRQTECIVEHGTPKDRSPSGNAPLEVSNRISKHWGNKPAKIAAEKPRIFQQNPYSLF
jgi:hypothetical protein